MSNAQSPCLLFPPLTWWQQILRCETVLLEMKEPFRKMTWRNRYRIATANGSLLLSIPVVGGRTLKTPMNEVLIDYRQDWQKQHWRSLFSAYGRAPFFEYYGPALERLLMLRPERLIDFNLAALEWITKELRLSIIFSEANKDQEPALDLLQQTFDEQESNIRYTQVFEDRHGFIPNLSILDLLMNEGPAATGLLIKKDEGF